MTRSADPSQLRPLSVAIDAWRRGATATRVVRLSVYVAAVVFATIAYRGHLDPQVAWTQWAVHLGVAVALMILALSTGEPSPGGRLRPLARVVGAAVALAAGWVAVDLSSQPGRELGAALAIVAALVGFLVFRWVRFDPSDIRALLGDRSSSLLAGAPTWRVTGGASAAVLLGLAATYWNPSNHLLGFCLWLASLSAFAAAFWPRDRAMEITSWQLDGGPQVSLSTERFALLAILVLAIALRFTLLEDVPAWISPDEGRLGRYAERMWANGFPDAFGLGWNAFPNLSYMVLYSWVQALGTSNPHLRLSAAMVGVVSLVPMFYWARMWWGNVIALTATFLLAVNQTHLMWSRIGFNNIHQILVAALILLCFARVLRRGRAIDWVGLGFASGLAFHTYHAAKMFPALLVPIGVLFAIGIPGFLRRCLPGLAIGSVAFALCLGPLIRTTIERWSYFYLNTSNRVDLSRLVDAYHAGNVQVVRDYIHTHVYLSMAAFTKIPNPAEAYLSMFVAVPFALGVGWMLWRWRDPRHLTLLFWIGSILVLGGMITDYPPATTRMLGFFPAVCVVPAVIAGRLRGMLSQWGKGGERTFFVLVASWLGVVSFTNWQDFFVTAPPRQRGQSLAEICRVIRRTPPSSTLYMVGGDSEAEPRVVAHDCMVATDRQPRFVNLMNGAAAVPLPAEHRGAAVIVVSRLQREVAPLVAQAYPEASYDVVYDRGGEPMLHVFRLSAHTVERHRGLRAEYRSEAGYRLADRASSSFAPPTGEDFPLQARWSGRLYVARPGEVRLRVSAGELRLYDRPVDPEQSMSLAAGWHPIEISTEFASLDEPATAFEWNLDGSWTRVSAQHLNDQTAYGGLLGRYFDRAIDTVAAVPIDEAAGYERIDSAISFHYRAESDDPPPPPLAARPSTMEWNGSVDFGGRPRRLRVEASSPTAVYLGGELIVDLRDRKSAEVDLAPRVGRASLLVRSVRPQDDDRRRWKLRVLWREPGGAWSVAAGYRLPDVLGGER